MKSVVLSDEADAAMIAGFPSFSAETTPVDPKRTRAAKTAAFHAERTMSASFKPSSSSVSKTVPSLTKVG
jgi:hypothetical protein